MSAHLLTRGIIHSTTDPYAQALLVRDGMIAWLGADDSADRVADPGDERRDLDGAVVAIGNAPTALFHLLEMLRDGAPRPAAIVGMPVGFVGSAESKVALAEHRLDDGSQIPCLTVHGRRGGSAMAAAAVNALATEQEIL